MEGGSEKTTPEGCGGESKSKRKMKTAAQLEVLENTYSAEPYPSEAIRADLSVKLNLSDRQLQMWFCHRRLKERKSTTPSKRQRKELVTPTAMESWEPPVNAGDLVAGNELDSRRAARGSGGSGVTVVRRFNEPSSAEVRAIGYVEAQLGERLRDNGPVLGMEFDPLPPGAFGMPIEMPSHRKATRQAFETNIYVRSDVKPIKDHVRPIREYQFIPELPSSRTDHSERVSPSHHFGVPLDGSVMRVSAVSAGHRDDYKISPQIPNLNLATHQGKPGHVYSPNLVEYDSPYQKSYMDTAAQVHDDPFVKSEREVGNEDEDDDALQLERHRKNEEARIAREVEAHEKRIRRELEKQDMLRRKREEQIRKEMERQDRERRKEEERLLREKQREEERYLKEQMRELQRREKFLKKETIRAEKMRQKEEMRKEKEVARLKAANERAIARKIAKESMELIEDERLELMEVAALTKGLPSMLALDFETLQNLDEYRDKQAIFPPTSVKLKKPFAVKPWNGSDENVANLLMVWRFLITFADVLGLWPFTLDEFAQAFHDYDPRLMGEIHIVLLKTIIKDIEGVVRTLSTGVGANQNVAANPGGGHPHVVEGAYAWGFDIRSWRKNLNVFTWPEILRQLALSAGLGPQLKKMNIRTVSVHDDNEANNSENVIFNLRKGVAAENAFAKMQERGLSNPRRSRHRLTPGTVKFAAFHVLSLEGEKGLNILEVAEKIQKSGLRDLTTSRTPEASVAAALSRDTKLFERVAPSTYCVRASYRKDAGDAETIFAEARERIRAFKSGITDVEDVDDAERDEDSESDVGEDPEVDVNLKKEDPNPLKVENLIGVEPLLENGKLDTVPMKTELGLPLTPSLPEEMKDEKRDDTLADQSLEDAVANGEDSACFDESKLGEQWVQGLVEGDYSNLSSEERLNALVALIGIATEGNTIRIALEERLEVASALKKQMWGEVQLDKRWKEESLIRANYLSYPTAKPGLNIATPASGNQESSSADVTPISSQDPVSLPQIDVNNVIAGPSLQLQENVPGVENLQYQQQQGYTADRERLRAQLKAYVGYKAEELYVYRSLPLGQDRRRNRYWRFSASASRNDPGCGRIFVELQDGRWRLIDSEEAFDYLVKSLDVRGVRESHLHFMLLKIEASFKEALRRNVAANPGVCSISSSLDSDTAEISTTFKIELGDSNAVERCSVLQRFHSFEKWMWDNMLHPSALSAFKYGAKQSSPLFRICRICAELHFVGDICCPSCGQMHAGPDVGELCFAEQVAQLGDNLRRGDTGFILRSSILSPLRIRLLKVQLALVEASLPPEGLEAFWTENLRKSWGMKLLSSSSHEDLYQVLTTLEAALKRDFLSSNFETTSELLGLQEGALASDLTCGVNVLPWIPKTAGGVALRLFDFDSSIVYTPDQNNDPLKDKESEDFVGLETNILRNLHEKDVMETPVQVAAYKQEENWTDPGLGGVSSSVKSHFKSLSFSLNLSVAIRSSLMLIPNKKLREMNRRQQVKRRVGKYEVGRTIGEGTFAKVKFARNSETGEPVALKILDKEKVLKHKMAEQIRREIATMKLIKHPNVVQLYEVMASKTKIFIILEYVTGGELFDKIVNDGRMKEDEARRYFQQLIHAVDYCHSRGVYHRDLKPENLLLDSYGNLKISDFGLSALSQQVRDDGLLHTSCGTPNYVAPEVLNDRGYDGATADMWSCGVVLYVLLAGYLPFDDSNLMNLYKKISSGEFNCPPWLSLGAMKLITRILDPNPMTRVTPQEVFEDEWFKKDYKPPVFEERDDSNMDDIDAVFKDSEEHLVTEKREEQPAAINAFEIISMSRGLNLENLFDPEQEFKRETRITLRGGANEIIEKIEEAAKPLGFDVQKKNYKMRLENVKAGRKGNLNVATEIFQVAPSLHMVQVSKSKGDTLEFHKFYKKLSNSLEQVVWTNNEVKKETAK